MNAIGLVVEYNPLHNGHLYQIEEINKLFPENIKIVVMSGDFVQRGEPSIVNKIAKTKMCLSAGIDIVLELPCFYSTQSAELFARGAVGILNSLFCNYIVFGSESNDINYLNKIKEKLSQVSIQDDIKKYLDEGLSYVNATMKALDEELKSNDILGLEYLKAIDFWKSSIKPLAIKREKTGYYSVAEKNSNENISSATDIRNKILSAEAYKNFVSEEVFDILEKEKKVSLEDFYPLIRYAILNSKDKIKDIADMELGLENRLYQNALKHNNFKRFFQESISKRLTIGRFQRILIHILLDIKKEDIMYLRQNIPYIKILAMTNKGQEYLSSLKKELKEKKVLSSNKNIQKILNKKELYYLELNERASEIYKIISAYESPKFLEIK